MKWDSGRVSLLIIMCDWWLAAAWRQGMLTIGSTPDPGALHLTQGVVRVVGGVNFGFSTISMHILA